MHSRGSMNDIMISIHPEYIQKILTGEKTIELRTRLIRVAPQTKIWIYSTLPQGAIVATAAFDAIYAMTPSDAWINYSHDLCLTPENYRKYTQTRDMVYLFKLVNIKQLCNSVSLNELRSVYSAFQPPQFFMYITNSSIMKLLETNQ